MIERIDLGEPNVVAYEMHDELTDKDIDRIHNDLRAALSAHDSVRMYTDVTDLGGMEPEAFIKDLKMTPEYVAEIDKYAIVGEQRWHEYLSKIGDMLSKGKARYFEPDEANLAKEWVGQ